MEESTCQTEKKNNKFKANKESINSICFFFLCIPFFYCRCVPSIVLLLNMKFSSLELPECEGSRHLKNKFFDSRANE